MQTKATKKFIRSSPRKMRLVVDMVRGKKGDEALNILKFSTKLAARDAEKVIRSAISNLANFTDGKPYEPNEVRIAEIYVNQGPTMKRMLPAPMGRAYRIRKRSNHLTVVVNTLESLE
jgi:large subunit ribosomal protein L22